MLALSVKKLLICRVIQSRSGEGDGATTVYDILWPIIHNGVPYIKL